MINLSVINLRNIIKKFFKMVFFLAAIFALYKISIKILKTVDCEELKLKIGKELIENDLLFLNLDAKKDDENYKKILVAELSILSDSNVEVNENIEEENIEEIVVEEQEVVEDNINEEMEEQVEEVKNTENIENVTENDVNIEQTFPAETKVIEENNIKEVYTDIYKTVKIRNESKYVLTEEMVTPDIDYSDKKDLMIYHTHTCESYSQTESSRYESSGNYRTLNKEYSVVRVGNELTNLMAGKGYTVIHDDTVHDYPAYNGSYNRSLVTINNLHSVYSSVDMIFDIHRDALGSNENYAPCVQIGNEKVAQLMFVIGTDGGGLSHSNWNSNLKLAIKIQEKANEMYPGLFRPIILRNSRYNQHISQGSAIIEVGATGNTLEESVGSMKYLANVLNEVMKE